MLLLARAFPQLRSSQQGGGLWPEDRPHDSHVLRVKSPAQPLGMQDLLNFGTLSHNSGLEEKNAVGSVWTQQPMAVTVVESRAEILQVGDTEPLRSRSLGALKRRLDRLTAAFKVTK